ncbi:SDR family NAD(P)-dependent oxidoreductase [Actinocorallia populi]|uniref:SDR family NAD(P)-dependent oxidoreductase n=1 Tax=Actinocorallia populi TaxID=2079200 RepID=UPI000D08E054|nr:SDR family NAD(P)-dependent oxidoreductase [Actinocorallia populi]
MSGKLAVVTGGSGGLGLATATGLAGAGAEVVLAGRDPERLRIAAERIHDRHPGAPVRGERLDLASLASVADFAGRLADQGRPLDLLVNNAAVLYIPRRTLTEDGFELTMATNHLGHFALTGRLVPLLLRAPAPRVVTVCSLTAKVPALDLADLMSERNYRPLTAYAKSKMAVLLFALELQRRATRALTSVAVNPGSASTGLYRHSPAPVRGLGHRLDRLLGRSTQDAASVILYGATSSDVVPGGFYAASGLLGRRGTPRPAPLPKAARDHALARDLWLKSEALTGVRPSFPARSLTV